MDRRGVLWGSCPLGKSSTTCLRSLVPCSVIFEANTGRSHQETSGNRWTPAGMHIVDQHRDSHPSSSSSRPASFRCFSFLNENHLRRMQHARLTSIPSALLLLELLNLCAYKYLTLASSCVSPLRRKELTRFALLHSAIVPFLPSDCALASGWWAFRLLHVLHYVDGLEVHTYGKILVRKILRNTTRLPRVVCSLRMSTCRVRSTEVKVSLVDPAICRYSCSLAQA